MVVGMGGGDPAPQTFLDRCEQGERRYRKRRGGGWIPEPFRMGHIRFPVGFGQSHGGSPAMAGKSEMSKQGA